jgi:hypothetical protein
VLAVLGFGPAPSYAERSTIQNRISFLKVVKMRSFKARSFATYRRLLVVPRSARKSSLREGATGTALASGPLRRKTRLEERGEPDEGE